MQAIVCLLSLLVCQKLYSHRLYLLYRNGPAPGANPEKHLFNSSVAPRGKYGPDTEQMF